MKNLFMLIFTVVLGLGLLLGDAPSMYAQEGGDDEFMLEDVLVTAQKREENQQKVGIPMEIFSGELLTELGRYDVDQILGNVSSAFIARTTEGLRVSLRGVAFDTPSGYGEGAMNAAGTVAVNIDGVFTAKRPTGTALYDIERVEVLYGPQATIYASNAPGGIVNFVLKKPNLDEYEFNGSLEYGSYNLLHFEGAMNVPVSDTFAIRGAFNSIVRDGYLSNGGDDEDSRSGRLRLLWEPNDKFSFLVTGEYETSTGRGTTGVPAFIDEDDVADPWFTPIELTGLPRETSLKKYNAHINYDFGYGVLTIIPAFADDEYYRTESGPAPGPPPPVIRDTVTEGWGKEDGFEIRIDSPPDSRIVWNIGYNWYEGRSPRWLSCAARTGDRTCAPSRCRSGAPTWLPPSDDGPARRSSARPRTSHSRRRWSSWNRRPRPRDGASASWAVRTHRAAERGWPRTPPARRNSCGSCPWAGRSAPPHAAPAPCR